MNDLKNKVAVVTGGGGGIGRAVAVRLAKEKTVVELLGGNDGEKLKTTAEMVEDAGTECIVVGGDLTEKGFLRAGIEKIVAKAGGVDILVNNAGMAYNAKFEDTGEEIFDRIMRINVKVPYFLTQAALPYLRRSKSASVINISSVVGHAGYPLQSAYAASKHAVLGFTKSLAAEVYGEGIRVHAISPGGVYTDMVKVARPDLSPEGMILPEEIAEIVLFFLVNRGNAVVDEILVHRVNKTPFLI